METDSPEDVAEVAGDQDGDPGDCASHTLPPVTAMRKKWSTGAHRLIATYYCTDRRVRITRRTLQTYETSEWGYFGG